MIQDCRAYTLGEVKGSRFHIMLLTRAIVVKVTRGLDERTLTTDEMKF
jgi:hypothetical protein